ncbi:carbohydrate-binding domain-containing protein [Tunicatimonas pelagia]|uniref:carbohydrate-binding domain-containing protein n=1 Tax=Tunicatimonas pelagia TaxID=931531 RepID=UPI002666AFF5|nr:carbohydrate-binding domain-containing protein [Tunicatimonas pelagia]WKN44879.1 carbohydrate-binding domain-containing protein [Tunicatimonas pelagia]
MNTTKLLICIVLLLLLGPVAQAQEYRWNRMSTGGGGYMTGIQFHPQVPGLKYVRTDVAAPFRMDPGSDSWVYTGDKFSPDFRRMGGSDGIALHPTDPNVVFAFIGNGDGNSPERGLYRSANQGEDWEQVLEVYTHGNNKPSANPTTRAQGEPLAIDPNNPDYLYAGTQRDGLFRSTTGGGADTWTSIGNIPTFNGVGIRCVAIDPAFTTGSPARSQYIYVSNFSEGIYLSADGGENYTLMSGSPTGTASRMRLGPDGNLYVATLSGFWRYIPGTPYENGTWDNISPNGPTSTTAFTSFDVRQTANGLEFLVGQGSQRIWRKRGNSDWELVSVADGTMQEEIINGFKNVRDVGAGNISDIKFDPFSDDVWFTDVFMVWKSTNIWAPVTEWAPQYKNITNTITIDLSTPPASEVVNNGILYTGHPDVEGFRFDDVNEPWSVKYTGLGPDATSIDFCEESPEVMYFCKTNKFNPEHQGRVFRSGDGIDPANRSSEVRETFIPEEFYSISFPHDDFSTPGVNEGIGLDVGGAKIAVSATDPMNAVYFSGADAKGTKYTLDGGVTWADCEGLPTGGFVRRQCNGCSEYDFPMPIAADRIAGNTFYAFYDLDHTFWKSENHGVSWIKVAQASSDLPAWRGNSEYDPYRMAAAPYKAGEVWIALDDNGLYRSSDFGESFSKVSGIAQANQVAWGKNKPGQSNPTAYVYGRQGDQWGIYRSDDMGDSWQLITPSNLPGGYPRALAADRQVYGRVYAGHVTTGVRYGELTTPPVADVSPDAPTIGEVTVLTSSSVQVTWQDNADNELKYRIYRQAEGESDFTRVGLAGYDDTVYVDQGLLPETTYRYRVVAWNDGGSARSEERQDTTLPSLTSLTLSATCAQFPAVDRRWKVNNPNPFAVDITWTVAGSSQTDSYDATPGESFFVTETVDNDNTVIITWTDEFGNDLSDTRASTDEQCDLPVPAAPEELTVADVLNSNPTTADLRLSWTDVATNEDVYEVERRGADGTYERIATLDSGATSYTDQGLAVGQTFRYRIRAFNHTLGHSPYVSGFSTTANAFYEIVSAPASKRLSADNPFANGTTVFIENQSFFDKQRWVFEAVGGGFYHIRSKASDKLLTVRNSSSSPAVSLYDADGTGVQRWRINKVTSDPSDNNYYVVDEEGNVLTVDNPSANRSPVSSETNIFFGKQQWQFVAVESIPNDDIIDEGAIVVRARGNCGSEEMVLHIDGQEVERWTSVGTTYTDYTYEGYSGGEVSVAFVNDGGGSCDRNLFVDYVDVCGTRIQSESTEVVQTSTWTNGDKQALFTNGNNHYGDPGCNPTEGQATFGNGGAPWPVSDGAVLELENYDTGGPGVAYLDTDPENIGESYRTDAVDIRTASDLDGGFNVGWTEDGEWLEYTVDVNAGTYDLFLRTASGSNEAVGDVRIKLGETTLGTFAVENTGGWQNWEDVVLGDVALPGGEQVLRLEMVGRQMNLNRLSFATAGGANQGAIVVRARGNCGSEEMVLRVDGTEVERWTNVGTTYTDYTYEGYSGGEVSVAFVNDGGGSCDRNLFVDYVDVCGTRIQSESTEVVQTSTWTNGDKQALFTNGNNHYGDPGCNTNARWGNEVSKGLGKEVENRSEGFGLYPNPAQGEVQLRLPQEQPAVLRVLDLTGRVVLEKYVQRSQTINIQNLPKGLYTIHAQQGSVVMSEKLLVE